MAEVRLRRGDLLPRVVLPDPGDNAVDLSHQSIAGRPILLWVLAEDGADADRLAAMLDDFTAVEAQVFAVVSGAAPGVSEALETAGVPQLIDEAQSVAGAFGLEGASGLVLIDAAARIARVEEGTDFDAMLAACRAFFDASLATAPPPHAPVLVIEELLDAQMCRDLIALWEAGQKVGDAVATGEGKAGAASASLKRRQDVYLSDRNVYEAIGARIRNRAFPEVRRAFQAKLESFELPRIGCYDSTEAGFFGRHRDNSTPHTAHRLFAMTLNLNTGDFSGGQLRFPEFGRQLYEAPTGGAVIFSCALLHEALPVTEGRRFGLFSFFTDAAGAKREQALIAAEKAKGRSGVRQS